MIDDFAHIYVSNWPSRFNPHKKKCSARENVFHQLLTREMNKTESYEIYPKTCQNVVSLMREKEARERERERERGREREKESINVLNSLVCVPLSTRHFGCERWLGWWMGMGLGCCSGKRFLIRWFSLRYLQIQYDFANKWLTSEF